MSGIRFRFAAAVLCLMAGLTNLPAGALASEKAQARGGSYDPCKGQSLNNMFSQAACAHYLYRETEKYLGDFQDRVVDSGVDFLSLEPAQRGRVISFNRACNEHLYAAIGSGPFRVMQYGVDPAYNLPEFCVKETRTIAEMAGIDVDEAAYADISGRLADARARSKGGVKPRVKQP